MKARLRSMEPVLTVRSFDRARAFYGGKLGFDGVSEGGAPATLGSFARDGFTLWVAEPGANHREDRIGRSSIDLGVDDIRALRDEFTSSGLTIEAEITTGPDDDQGNPVEEQARLYQFTVRDPDDNQLVFTQDLNQEADG